MLEGGHVVADFPYVVSFGLARHGSIEDLRDRSLRTFDPRARDRFTGDVGVDQQVRIGQETP